MHKRTFAAAIAAALILGQALPAMAEHYNDGVIFCKVKLHGMPNAPTDGNAYFSVTLPATAGATDSFGNSATIWNLGDVQCGGVYDSFYNGGPGYFRVQNTGNMPAYIYVSTGFEGEASFTNHPNVYGWEYFTDSGRRLFGEIPELYEAAPSPKFFGQDDNNSWTRQYALAVSTDVTGIVPNWRPLSYLYVRKDGSPIWEYVDFHNSFDAPGTDNSLSELCYVLGYEYESPVCTAFLAHMPVGETQLFDLKFWAPLENDFENSFSYFVVRIEASPFPRWDHDR